jgi:hypothetical protein
VLSGTESWRTQLVLVIPSGPHIANNTSADEPRSFRLQTCAMRNPSPEFQLRPFSVSACPLAVVER